MNLNQITIPSLDINTAISFYKKLGLELIVYSQDHYARFLCPEGDSTFSIHQVSALPSGDGIYIYFETENLEEKVKDLLDKGIIFEHLPKEQSWLWKEARLKDPDANQIIIYNAGENRINPPWRLKS
tara:strand:- start:30809 stop:31189 length:381 start_codon:yes stop_codon:yes gene_type:complete